MVSVPIVLRDCTVLGAAGFPFSPGDKTSVVFDGDVIGFGSGTDRVQFSLVELAELSVNGSGTVVTGGGFAGGGFGIEGALQGMAIAGVLNALTTKKTIQTFLTLTSNFGELHLHYGSMEPAALRIVLCSVFTRLRYLDRNWRNSRLQVIDDQLAGGSITPDEAELFRSRLNASRRWPGLGAEQNAIEDTGPMGTCPSCDKIIPLSSEKCGHCKANFGAYSSWSVIPLGA